MRTLSHLTAIVLLITSSFALPGESHTSGDTLVTDFDNSAEINPTTETTSSSVASASSTTATASASLTTLVPAAITSTTAHAASSIDAHRIKFTNATNFLSHGASKISFLKWDKAKRAAVAQDSTLPSEEPLVQLAIRSEAKRDNSDVNSHNAIPIQKRDHSAIEDIATNKAFTASRRSLRRRSFVKESVAVNSPSSYRTSAPHV